MKRMSDKRAHELITQMRDAADQGSEAYLAWRDGLPYAPVALEFPTGEIAEKYFADTCGGFLWAWKLTNRFEYLQIDDADRFKAQGLEGKIRVRTGLTTALMVYDELREYRRQIILL